MDINIGNFSHDGSISIKEIAKLSYEYRTLGLGYANLRGYLMSKGVAYDSEKVGQIAAITALMTGISYATSAEVASEQGPSRLSTNSKNMLRVMRNHRRAAYGKTDEYEGLHINPVPFVVEDLEIHLGMEAQNAWDQLMRIKVWFRNANNSNCANWNHWSCNGL